MKYTKITRLSKGWSSYIWLVRDEKWKEFVLKEPKEKSTRSNTAEREGKMLLLANRVGVGPKVKEVNYKENFVVMDYVRGEKLLDWVMGEEFNNEVKKEELWEFLKKLYGQLIAIDSVHLSHNQLQIGKNILVVNKTQNLGTELGNGGQEKRYIPVIIDFEKATVKENGTKNIGQIESMFFYNPHGALAKKIREKLGATL